MKWDRELAFVSTHPGSIIPAYQMLTSLGTTISNEKRCIVSRISSRAKRSPSAIVPQFAPSTNENQSWSLIPLHVIVLLAEGIKDLA